MSEQRIRRASLLMSLGYLSDSFDGKKVKYDDYKMSFKVNSRWNDDSHVWLDCHAASTVMQLKVVALGQK